MAKFKANDWCRVLKNALAPSCIGHIVTIIKPLSKCSGVQYYMTIEKTNYGDVTGIASENCLELVKR